MYRSQLVSTAAGIRVCIQLLDQISFSFDVEEDSAESQAFQMGFVISPTRLRPDLTHSYSYEVFRCLFDLSLTNYLWDSLKM